MHPAPCVLQHRLCTPWTPHDAERVQCCSGSRIFVSAPWTSDAERIQRHSASHFFVSAPCEYPTTPSVSNTVLILKAQTLVSAPHPMPFRMLISSSLHPTPGDAEPIQCIAVLAFLSPDLHIRLRTPHSAEHVQRPPTTASSSHDSRPSSF